MEQNKSITLDSDAARPVENTASAAAKTNQPDFLKSIMDTAKAAEKQVYSGVNQSAPGGPVPVNGPDGQPLPPIDGPSQVNLDSEDKIRSEAKLWVFGLDLAASRGLKWYSKRGTLDQFKMTPGEKEELTNSLADYFKTLPETPKLPPWLILMLTALMIFGAKALIAHDLRINPPMEKQEPEEVTTSTKVVQLVPKPKKEGPKKRRKKRLPTYDPSKPYWMQQYDRNGKLILNPVTEAQNEQRKLKGGAPCLNCKENHCALGKNACSQHCSGKLKKKNVGSIQTN